MELFWASKRILPAAGDKHGSSTNPLNYIADNDWVIREESGRERGHYSNRHDAESVGRLLARKRKAALMIHEPTGDVRTERASPRGWIARLFGW